MVIGRDTSSNALEWDQVRVHLGRAEKEGKTVALQTIAAEDIRRMNISDLN